MTATPAPRPQPLLGAAIVFAAALLFSMNGTVSTIVLGDALAPLDLVELRCLGAALVFGLVALAWRPRIMRIGPRELAFVAVYGIVGLAMVQWLYLASIQRMPVSVTLLIEFTAPLMVALWVRFVRGEDVRRRVWVALVLCLVGLAMVARVWSGLSFDGIGLLAAAVSAVALAVYYLLGERGLGSRDSLSLAAWSFTTAAVLWLVVHPLWSVPLGSLGNRVDLDAVTDGLLGLHAPLWALVSWVVVLGTIAPFGLVLLGLRRIGPTRAGLIGTAEPPMAGVIAWVVLGQTLSGIQITGGLVVLAAIVLAETSRRQPPPVTEALPPA